jgi:hypothetical protein
VSCFSDDLFDDENLLYYAIYDETPSLCRLKVSEEVANHIKEKYLHTDFVVLRESLDCRHSDTTTTYYYDNTNKMLISLVQTTTTEHYKKIKNKKKDCTLTIAYSIKNQRNRIMLDEIRSFNEQHKEDDSLCVHFLEKEYGELTLTPHKLEHFPLDIDSHYNDDFKEEHKRILEWGSDFTETNKKLSLFHGIPGAGKTNYIKFLMTQLPDVRKIYIPPFFVESIADPAFMTFIKDYDSSLLIAEDCEAILQKRENSGSANAASILLNLTDGILASVLNFKIICTFNSSEKDIDPALLRKGRLFTKYKFDKLKEDKTADLYEKLYGKSPPEKEMDLASIYNSDDNGIEKKEERRVGFGV